MPYPESVHGNQHSVSTFPYHYEGVWSADPYNDQFQNPENFHGGPEDQFFLPMVPGRTYRIVLTPCAQVGAFDPPGLPYGRTNLILWHDTANYYRYGEITGDTLGAVGVFPNPLPDGLLVLDLAPAIGMVWIVGAPQDENGSAAIDPLTRISVNGVNATHFPTYTLDISIVGGSGSRYYVE